MIILPFILIALSCGFKSSMKSMQEDKRWKWIGMNRDSHQMALQLKIIEVPVQSNLLQYYSLLVENLGDENILRWYIAKIEDKKATIEVVYDDLK
mmetsp:Transcript_31879/g.45883  ORF Transcript_31879/g.45883 Transcript_31879/m.45883 type:complete len:95 (-) Transcript_31879:445-729(-)